jgi:hypothetical protein
LVFMRRAEPAVPTADPAGGAGGRRGSCPGTSAARMAAVLLAVGLLASLYVLYRLGRLLSSERTKQAFDNALSVNTSSDGSGFPTKLCCRHG